MNFRVTPQTFFSNAISNAQRHNRSLVDLQNQATTGLRLTKPSDDPAAMQRLLVHRHRDARFDAQRTNLQTARTTLNRSYSELLEASKLFVRAKNVALQANPFENPQMLASEIDSMLGRLQAIANSHDGEQYMFGGTAVGTAPFAVSSNGGGAMTQVRYVGSQQPAQTAIGSLAVDVRYPGREVFQPRNRQATLYWGNTGAAAGTGTDSGTGQATLTVRHTATNYAAGSGIAAGASSSADDTILGAHSLEIDAAGTLALNGGTAVAFDGTETDLKITGPQGEVVFVDTTGITPAFSGTVAITADGTLSIDGGATEIPIDFSANQVVVDSATGAVTNVNSTNIRLAGAENLEYTGTADAFQALIQLRDTLRNTQNVPDAQWQAAVERRVGDLQRIHDHLLGVIGEQSTALENLDAVERRIEDLQLETRTMIANTESADLAQVALRLQSEQLLLQFTLASSVQLMNQSILDFLR